MKTAGIREFDADRELSDWLKWVAREHGALLFADIDYSITFDGAVLRLLETKTGFVASEADVSFHDPVRSAPTTASNDRTFFGPGFRGPIGRPHSTPTTASTNMKPSETAETLRRIAAAIDNSKTPDRKLVAADLKKVLASIESEPAPAKPDQQGG